MNNECLTAGVVRETPIFQYGSRNPEKFRTTLYSSVRVSVESTGIHSTCTGVCHAYEHTRVDVCIERPFHGFVTVSWIASIEGIAPRLAYREYKYVVCICQGPRT